MYFLFVIVWLSVSVQSIAWKDYLWNDLLCVKWDVKPYTLTHSSNRCRNRCRWSMEME